MKRSSLLLTCALMLTTTAPVLVAQIHLTAIMNGSQQVPPVATGASGTGSFELSEDLTEVRFIVSYQGMTTSGVDGHLHAGSPGVNGDIVKEIITPSSTNGTFTTVWKNTDAVEPLTPAMVDSLLTGKLYINLHDPYWPGGEIRGQILLATSLHFEVNFNGAQVVPPSATSASGTGVFILDPTRTQVDFRVTYRGISSLLLGGGRVHVGVVGVNGASVRIVTPPEGPPTSSAAGTWKSTDVAEPLTAALVDSLIAGRMYCSFHTSSFPDGEIRGQLVLKSGIGFLASIDGTHENPPNGSGASGTGSFILNSSHNEIAYSLTYAGLSGPLTGGGHIHAGSAGTNGAVATYITGNGEPAEGTLTGIWKTSDPTQPLTEVLVESLLTGKLYTNFHTSSFQNGEIRGQLNLTTGVSFTAQLSARNENPPTGTGGGGTGSVVLSPDRQIVSYSVTYYGLTGVLSAAGGHFHTGAQGTNGGVVKQIAAGGGPAAQTVNGIWSAADGTQPLTPELVNFLIAGNVYTNFHTATFPGGEIRGQLSYGLDALTSVRDIPGAVPTEFRLEQNYPNPFNPTTVVSFQVPVAGNVRLVVYDILGREVTVLVNERKSPGTYSVVLNASNLASGAYFYRLSMDNGVTASRKMVVLK